MQEQFRGNNRQYAAEECRRYQKTRACMKVIQKVQWGQYVQERCAEDRKGQYVHQRSAECMAGALPSMRWPGYAERSVDSIHSVLAKCGKTGWHTIHFYCILLW